MRPADRFDFEAAPPYNQRLQADEPLVETVSSSAALDPPPFGLRIGAVRAGWRPTVYSRRELFSNGSPLIRDPLCGDPRCDVTESTRDINRTRRFGARVKRVPASV